MLPTPRLRLRADPIGFFSPVFQVFDTRTGERVTRVTTAHFGFHADFHLDGVRHEVLRGGWLPAVYLMQAPGGVVCRATRHSIFHRSLEVQWGDESFRLLSSLFSRTFDISRAGSAVGTIRPQGPFSRGLTLEAPAEFPPDLAIFLIVVTLYVRRQRRRN